MNKGLEDLARGKKRNKVVAFIKDGDAVLSKQEIATIEKELKALEIIKNSVVATPNIPIIKTLAGEFIEITLAVTKDKYDLLKEVLL